MKTNTLEQQYMQLLKGIADDLEGGDIALDFEDLPCAQAVIGCIMAIVSSEIMNIKAIDNFRKAMNLIKNQESIE